MGLFWELFQEHQIGKTRNDTSSIDDQVSSLDDDLTWLFDIVGQMAKLIDDLEAQLGAVEPPAAE